jgi:hypothetical protein
MKTPETKLQKGREWYYANREKRMKQISNYKRNSPVRKAWFERTRFIRQATMKVYTRKRYEEIRMKLLERYGGKPPHCKCCGEMEFSFLSIDHINGGGKKHFGKRNSYKIYLEIFDENNPEKYQVLCMNCNVGKRIHGICPHQKRNSEEAMNMTIEVIENDRERS